MPRLRSAFKFRAIFFRRTSAVGALAVVRRGANERARISPRALSSFGMSEAAAIPQTTPSNDVAAALG